jgi:hypothetical protein
MRLLATSPQTFNEKSPGSLNLKTVDIYLYLDKLQIINRLSLVGYSLMIRITSTFSKPFNDAMIRSELIQEMMVADGWSKDDEEWLLTQKKVLEIFDRHADAALRVFRRIEERENNLKPSDVE